MSYPSRLNEANLSDFDLVSLDLFDTLVFRRCGHPHGIFSQLGGFLVEQGVYISVADFALARVWAERVARTQSAAEEVTLSEIYRMMGLDLDKSDFIMSRELYFEEQNIYATLGTKRLLNRLAASGVKVVISSDMYLPRDFLYEVFKRQTGTAIPFEDFYVSSADFRTKTSGKRFLFLESLYRVPRERILHIGDNRHADYHVPISLGFKADLVTPISDSFSNPSLSLSVERRSASKAWDPSFYSLEIGGNKLARYYYDLGLSLLGPLAYGINLHIHWVAGHYGLNRILALMREGAFIANNFKFIRSRLEIGRAHV
jgi:FMN phosphatase YigB (HAD superfamily)